MQSLIKLRHILTLSIIAFFGIFVSCNDDPTSGNKTDFSTVPEPYDTSNVTPVKKSSGLIYYEIEEGSGEFSVVERDAIQAHYTLRDSTGDIKNSSYKNGSTTPSQFNLPSTIRGFREGVVGMKPGGKRTIVVPPRLGYNEGSSQTNLVGITLYFDVKMDSILSQ